VILLATDTGSEWKSCMEMLSSLSQLFTSGHVPDIFSASEIKGVLDAMMEEPQLVSDLKLRPSDFSGVTTHVVWQEFTRRCRQNVHVVLCMQKQSDLLLSRATAFPQFFKGIPTVMFQDWSSAICKEVNHTGPLMFV
jgi:hypothetical protein